MQKLKEISMHFQHNWCSEMLKWRLKAPQKVLGIKSSETNVIFAVDGIVGLDEITEVTFYVRGLSHGYNLTVN